MGIKWNLGRWHKEFGFPEFSGTIETLAFLGRFWGSSGELAGSSWEMCMLLFRVWVKLCEVLRFPGRAAGTRFWCKWHV